MKNKNIILHLSLISEIGSSTIWQIIKQIGQDNLSDLYWFSIEDMQRFGISQDKAQRIVQGLQDKSLLDRELFEIEKQGAGFVTIACNLYPKLLKEIEVPPVVLYYQGNAELFMQQKMFACVGARKAHSYTQEVVNKLVVPMIKDDWVIVSGGALGADTYAHKATLEYGGKTVVVIGGGLYYQYPPKNHKMFEQIINAGGVIVSSFPIKQQPEARCFPIRNRIISGISQGCLVLQAARKSGALITAQFALEQGREVFAVPGPIYDPLSAGCHDLIKQGAKLVECTEDIYEEFSLFFNTKLQSNFAYDEQQQTNFIQEKNVVIRNINQNKTYQKNHSSSVRSECFTKQNVSKDEQAYNEEELQILQHTVVAVSTEQLLAKIMIEPQLLHQKLFTLSIDGKIEQDCMGLWKRK